MLVDFVVLGSFVRGSQSDMKNTELVELFIAS